MFAENDSIGLHEAEKNAKYMNKIELRIAATQCVNVAFERFDKNNDGQLSRIEADKLITEIARE